MMMMVMMAVMGKRGGRSHHSQEQQNCQNPLHGLHPNMDSISAGARFQSPNPKGNLAKESARLRELAGTRE